MSLKVHNKWANIWEKLFVNAAAGCWNGSSCMIGFMYQRGLQTQRTINIYHINVLHVLECVHRRRHCAVFTFTFCWFNFKFVLNVLSTEFRTNIERFLPKALKPAMIYVYCKFRQLNYSTMLGVVKDCVIGYNKYASFGFTCNAATVLLREGPVFTLTKLLNIE